MGFSQFQRTAPKHPKGIGNHTSTNAQTEASNFDEGRIFAIRSERQQARCKVRVKQTSHARHAYKDGTGKFVLLSRYGASFSVSLTRTQALILEARAAVCSKLFQRDMIIIVA